MRLWYVYRAAIEERKFIGDLKSILWNVVLTSLLSTGYDSNGSRNRPCFLTRSDHVYDRGNLIDVQYVKGILADSIMLVIILPLCLKIQGRSKLQLYTPNQLSSLGSLRVVLPPSLATSRKWNSLPPPRLKISQVTSALHRRISHTRCAHLKRM